MQVRVLPALYEKALQLQGFSLADLPTAGGLIASAVALVGFAVLGAMSIGVFLLPAVVLAFIASDAAIASLPRQAASRARWTGVLIGLAFPAVALVAFTPS